MNSLVDRQSERHPHSHSRSRSRNSHTIPPPRRNANGINGSPASGSNMNSERYSSPRCRRSPAIRRCRAYTRHSPPIPLMPNQQHRTQTSCQSGAGGFASLLTPPVSPYLLDMNHRIQVAPQANQPVSMQSSGSNTCSNAIHSRPLNASANLHNSDSYHSGSQQHYRSQITSQSPNVASSQVCMCCFHQFRLANSQVRCVA